SQLADLRPSMPLRGGPSLTLASSPMSWQGEHNRLNTCSPAAASWAKLDPVEAASAITAITQILIIFSVLFEFCARPGAARFLATPFEWRFVTAVSTAQPTIRRESSLCPRRDFGS